jgi:hypothetical protein
MFPDEDNRPARHTMNTSDLRGKTLIQLDSHRETIKNLIGRRLRRARARFNYRFDFHRAYR